MNLALNDEEMQQQLDIVREDSKQSLIVEQEEDDLNFRGFSFFGEGEDEKEVKR